MLRWGFAAHPEGGGRRKKNRHKSWPEVASRVEAHVQDDGLRGEGHERPGERGRRELVPPANGSWVHRPKLAAETLLEVRAAALRDIRPERLAFGLLGCFISFEELVRALGGTRPIRRFARPGDELEPVVERQERGRHRLEVLEPLILPGMERVAPRSLRSDRGDN